MVTQKLRMPRSFDFGTTKTKRYDERLRMPKFPFDAAQREAVMTFILGLTSEPPSSTYAALSARCALRSNMDAAKLKREGGESTGFMRNLLSAGTRRCSLRPPAIP